MNNNSNLLLWGWDSGWEESFRPWSSDFFPGRITLQNHHFYTLQGPEGSWQVRVSGAFEYRATGPEDFPVVGDWVAFQPGDDQQGVIQHLLPRRTFLGRTAPVDRGGTQIMASNLDLGVIVMGLDQDYSPNRADRYLSLFNEGGFPGLVWLSKADLFPENALNAQAELSRRWPGVPVLAGDAKTGSPQVSLAPWLTPGKTLCLVGSSGAGKSTLINALVGQELRKTGETRSEDGKGRHTSTDRILIKGPGNVLLMDHPGLREVGLLGQETLSEDIFFPILDLAKDCRYRDCTHTDEPGCRVRQALAEGTLDSGLWKSFQRQKNELDALVRRKDPVLLRQEKDKWKAISKSIREFTKNRRFNGG